MKVRFFHYKDRAGPPMAERDLALIPRSGEGLNLNGKMWRVWSVAWQTDPPSHYVDIALSSHQEYEDIWRRT